MTGLPKRLRPEPSRRSVVGSERDVQVLSEIGWAGMLSTAQVERLAFPSRRRAQRRLRAYLDAGLVRAQLQADAMHRDTLWTLTGAGIELVEDRRGESGRLRIFRPNVRSQKLRHALMVRDVAVAFLVAERRGMLRLSDLRLDSDLADSPAMRQAGLIPDGLALLEISGDERLVLWEVASSAQPIAQVRAKAVAIVRARVSGLALFAHAGLVVLFAVEGQARLRSLAAATAALADAERIRVASPEDASDPVKLVGVIAAPANGFRPLSRPI